MKVAIIGGGAAGMMAAATINELDPKIEVFLIERNESLGKKVIISGGGRCNVTTGIEDIKTVLQNYPRGEKFLMSAMHAFSPAEVRAWFENHDVQLKCEKDLRVFPVSDNGRDVVGVFEKIFSENKTKLLMGHAVAEIKKENDAFIINFSKQPEIRVDVLILAVGGQAFRRTGSTGDGYAMAESLGHSIAPLAASLHSFYILEKWSKQLAGMSFVNANITAKGTKTHSRTGAFLFTHTGISGPAVFALSSLTAHEPFGENHPLEFFIDFVPEISKDELTERLKKSIAENPKKSFKNTLHNFVPAKLAGLICDALEFPAELKNAETNKQYLQKSVEWLKKLPLNATGRGAGEEFVTAGGVKLTEVNPSTMESKICPGLYFAGEILDIDGFTGGFNLQASWATGHMAGAKIATQS